MRDTIRPDGLRACILETESVIPLYIQNINSASDPSLKKGGKGMLMTIHMQKTIAHYSVGDDKEAVKQSLLEMIPAFIDGWNYENEGDYVDAIWPVCIGILCDIDLADFKKITSHIKKGNINDALLSTLIRSKQSDWPSSSNTITKFGNPYNRVTGLNSASDIKTYLDKHWYKEHEDDYWIDLHKSKTNNYFGYWAWEVAAWVKVKGIDDSSLKTQKYYPYDAVHW